MTGASGPAAHNDDERAHLAYQYSDAEKLRVRIESHRRYSERSSEFFDWMLPHIAPKRGLRLLDVGSGPGPYHPRLAAEGVRVVAVDQSHGMIREVLSQSQGGGYDATGASADASYLPFAAASFDRVMANHMLYYVKDQRTALEGMRRVLRPGGRIILATNAADSGAELSALHEAAARQLGHTPGARDASNFTLSDLSLVRSVFPSAVVHIREDAFVFPDARSAIEYYASGMVDVLTPPVLDGSHRQPLIDAVRQQIETIVARDGVFRVAKNSGCFVATA